MNAGLEGCASLDPYRETAVPPLGLNLTGSVAKATVLGRFNHVEEFHISKA